MNSYGLDTLTVTSNPSKLLIQINDEAVASQIMAVDKHSLVQFSTPKPVSNSANKPNLFAEDKGPNHPMFKQKPSLPTTGTLPFMVDSEAPTDTHTINYQASKKGGKSQTHAVTPAGPNSLQKSAEKGHINMKKFKKLGKACFNLSP